MNGIVASRISATDRDPYEAIRQAYLDGTDNESEPFEEPVETETPESPLIIAPPTSLPESTPPTLVPILRRTARMAVHVPPAMSPGLSASMADVATMSESTFRKRFRSSYNSSPSSSPPDFPSRKRYRGTSELVEDDDEEDEEIKEILDFDSVSEDAKDEDPAAGDEGLTAGDEGPGMVVESRGLDDESHGLRDESHGLDDEGYTVESHGLSLGEEEEEEGVPKGQQWTVLVVRTAVSAPLGLGYGALRHRELTLEENHVCSMFEVGPGSGFAPKPERPERVSASRQPTLTTWTYPKDGMVYMDVPTYPPPAPPIQTPPSPEWSSGSLSISPAPFIVPSPISSPMIPLTVPSPVATPVTAKTESRAVRDEIFSQRYRFKSLEHEHERVAVTFRALWRPVLALESWAGQTDAQRAALWHAISDTQGENRELRLQLAEERRVRLELAEIVDNMRRGQEPRGDV
ncbi:hypothetical protein Tco_0466600 [Tanacetum coccineum]